VASSGAQGRAQPHVHLPAFVQIDITDLILIGITERIETGVKRALPGCADFSAEKFSRDDSLTNFISNTGKCLMITVEQLIEFHVRNHSVVDRVIADFRSSAAALIKGGRHGI